MTFQIFTLITDNPLLEDPYCAINADGTRLLMTSDEMTRLELPIDKLELKKLNNNYIPTSQHVHYDLAAFEKLIQAHTQQTNFYFTALFSNEYRQVGLTFAKAPQRKKRHK